MTTDTLSGRPLRLLRTLHADGHSETSYCIGVKQSELAKQLGISRQALSSQLRKLRRMGYIRTGRGFIDITEKGLTFLGTSNTPGLVLIRTSQSKRELVYRKLQEIPLQRILSVKGDMDVILFLEPEKLDETLKKIGAIEGVEETKFYLTRDVLK